MISFLSGLWGKVAFVAAFLGLLALAALKVFGAGKAAAKAEATMQALKRVREARDVENRVDGASPDELERMRRKWERP